MDEKENFGPFLFKCWFEGDEDYLTTVSAYGPEWAAEEFIEKNWDDDWHDFDSIDCFVRDPRDGKVYHYDVYIDYQRTYAAYEVKKDK